MKAEAVKDLDLNKFQGLWYEIGSSGAIQKSFTKDCKCTSILFSLADNNAFNMLAKCINMSNDEVISARAKSVPFDGSRSSFSLVFAAQNASAAGGAGAAALKEEPKKKELMKDSQFVHEDDEEGKETAAKTPDYIILAVDDKAPDYGWAVIAAPKLDAVWILSRKPFLSDDIYNKLVSLIEEKGFTSTRMRKSQQKGCPTVSVRKMKQLERTGIQDELVYKKLKKADKFVPVGGDQHQQEQPHKLDRTQPLKSGVDSNINFNLLEKDDDDEGAKKKSEKKETVAAKKEHEKEKQPFKAKTTEPIKSKHEEGCGCCGVSDEGCGCC
jgi:lipocalin